MSEYKELTGDFWKPEKEDEFVEGLYINKEENVGENNSNIYYIEKLSDHSVVQMWGTTILDNRMALAKIGQQLKITYKGRGKKGKGGKQAPHIWKVEAKDVDAEDFDIPEDIK